MKISATNRRSLARAVISRSKPFSLMRGIDVVVAERRPANDPPNVKCGQIGARSMEIFRRLDVARPQIRTRSVTLVADTLAPNVA